MNRPLGVVTVLLLASGCGERTGSAAQTPSTRPVPTVTLVDPLPTPRSSDPRLRAAFDAAVRFSAAELPSTDAFTLVLLDYAWRRFGVAALAPARAAAMERVAGETPDANPSQRLIRPEVRPDVERLPDAATDPIGRMNAWALACDVAGKPGGFDRFLRERSRRGGYQLTHAAIATRLETDLGCPPTGGPQLQRELASRMLAEALADERVSDVAVERLAFLDYLGYLGRVPQSRIDDLVAQQRADGSFKGPDAAYRRHMSALVIWVLGSVVVGGDPQTPLALRG